RGAGHRLGAPFLLPALTLLAPPHEEATDRDHHEDQDRHEDRGQDQGLDDDLLERAGSGLCPASHVPAILPGRFLYWRSRHDRSAPHPARPRPGPSEGGAAPVSAPSREFDVEAVRADFPILSRMLDDDTPMIYRSEEHTSELQSRFDLVCRLLLEKK